MPEPAGVTREESDLGPPHDVAAEAVFVAVTGNGAAVAEVALLDSERLVDRIRAARAGSKVLSRIEALKAVANPAEAATELVRTQLARAFRHGALAGAAIGGSVSVVINGLALVKGRKSASEAAVSTLKDTATGAATGAAVSGFSVAAEAVLFKAGAHALSRSAAPVAIGLTLVEFGKDMKGLFSGDIDRKQLAARTSKNVLKGGTTWGGMEGGAAIGTLVLPGVGTVVGGAVGGIAGALLGGWITR